MTQIEKQIAEKAIELLKKDEEITPEVAKTIIQDEVVRQTLIDGKNVVYCVKGWNEEVHHEKVFNETAKVDKEDIRT